MWENRFCWHMLLSKCYVLHIQLLLKLYLVNVTLLICSYPLALDMIASGRIDVKPLITHRFSLKESLAAFEAAKSGAGGAIKIMIDCEK